MTLTLQCQRHKVSKMVNPMVAGDKGERGKRGNAGKFMGTVALFNNPIIQAKKAYQPRLRLEEVDLMAMKDL